MRHDCPLRYALASVLPHANENPVVISWKKWNIHKIKALMGRWNKRWILGVHEHYNVLILIVHVNQVSLNISLSQRLLVFLSTPPTPIIHSRCLWFSFTSGMWGKWALSMARKSVCAVSMQSLLSLELNIKESKMVDLKDGRSLGFVLQERLHRRATQLDSDHNIRNK